MIGIAISKIVSEAKLMSPKEIIGVAKSYYLATGIKQIAYTSAIIFCDIAVVIKIDKFSRCIFFM